MPPFYTMPNFYEQESQWIEWEYSSYTDEQIDNVLENADNYLDGHVKRMRFEKIKRLEQNNDK